MKAEANHWRNGSGGLIREAGSEVVITRRSRPVARLVRIVADPGDRLGSMRDVGTVDDLPWEAVDAGDRAVAELFGLGE